MTIIVHHLEHSRSQRILWLLEELGMSYTVRRYARDKRTMLAPPELRRVHPLGKSPVIEHVDAQGQRRVVAETGAIAEYLVDLAGGRLGAPEDDAGRLRYRHFLHYAEGSMMPPLFALLVVSRIPIFGKIARGKLLPMFATHLDWLDSELAARRWFAGADFTAADVMMSFPLEAARGRAGLDHRWPAIIAWLDTIHARPAYRAALEKGGPYAYA